MSIIRRAKVREKQTAAARRARFRRDMNEFARALRKMGRAIELYRKRQTFTFDLDALRAQLQRLYAVTIPDAPPRATPFAVSIRVDGSEALQQLDDVKRQAEYIAEKFGNFTIPENSND